MFCYYESINVHVKNKWNKTFWTTTKQKQHFKKSKSWKLLYLLHQTLTIRRETLCSQLITTGPFLCKNYSNNQTILTNSLDQLLLSKYNTDTCPLRLMMIRDYMNVSVPVSSLRLSCCSRAKCAWSCKSNWGSALGNLHSSCKSIYYKAWFHYHRVI